MIRNAIKYEEETNSKFVDIWYNEKYQYYFGGFSRQMFNFHEIDEYYKRSFVSLNQRYEVIGVITYQIDPEVNRAYNFGAINFSDDILTFAHDLKQVIDDIFIKFGMNKMEFNVICGNPVEKSYDRIVKRLGGRILCQRKHMAKLLNGTIVDDKMYEIMREDYVKYRNNR